MGQECGRRRRPWRRPWRRRAALGERPPWFGRAARLVERGAQPDVLKDRGVPPVCHVGRGGRVGGNRRRLVHRTREAHVERHQPPRGERKRTDALVAQRAVLAASRVAAAPLKLFALARRPGRALVARQVIDRARPVAAGRVREGKRLGEPLLRVVVVPDEVPAFPDRQTAGRACEVASGAFAPTVAAHPCIAPCHGRSPRPESRKCVSHSGVMTYVSSATTAQGEPSRL